jgi:AICAR transformylase/IMP cyclohydrolase PurH
VTQTSNKENSIEAIDIVCVNLSFVKTVANPKSTDEIIENIDIISKFS